MCLIKNHLHYIIRGGGGVEVCEGCVMVKINHRVIHKVAEKWDLKIIKTRYLEIRSQNNTSY